MRMRRAGGSDRGSGWRLGAGAMAGGCTLPMRDERQEGYGAGGALAEVILSPLCPASSPQCFGAALGPLVCRSHAPTHAATPPSCGEVQRPGVAALHPNAWCDLLCSAGMTRFAQIRVCSCPGVRVEPQGVSRMLSECIPARVPCPSARGIRLLPSECLNDVL